MLTGLINRIISIVFPNHCICCGKIIAQNYFCESCKDLFVPIKLKTCEKCGLPLKNCDCKWNFYYFDRIISVFENDGSVKSSFYNFKFNSQLLTGEYFAEKMAELIIKKYNDVAFDFVTFVPTHIATVRERGYDQTALIAKKIAKRLNIQYKKLLHQPKATVKQHESKSIRDRYDNVKNKYKISKSANLQGKTILLIDDIKTTGATLSECARQLKLAGAKKVFTATALITSFVKNNKD